MRPKRVSEFTSSIVNAVVIHNTWSCRLKSIGIFGWWRLDLSLSFVDTKCLSRTHGRATRGSTKTESAWLSVKQVTLQKWNTAEPSCLSELPGPCSSWKNCERRLCLNWCYSFRGWDAITVVNSQWHELGEFLISLEQKVRNILFIFINYE